MRAVGLLAPVLLLAGCAGVSIEGLQRSDTPREPFYEEYQGLVAPQHNQTYPVDVPADATLLNVTLHLVPRSASSLPPAIPPQGAAPGVVPAQLTLDVLDAAGRKVASAVADPSTPDIALLVKEVTVPGAWTVRVSGTGASGTVEGQDYGASYVLTLEVLFG